MHNLLPYSYALKEKSPSHSLTSNLLPHYLAKFENLTQQLFRKVINKKCAKVQ